MPLLVKGFAVPQAVSCHLSQLLQTFCLLITTNALASSNMYAQAVSGGVSFKALSEYNRNYGITRLPTETPACKQKESKAWARAMQCTGKGAGQGLLSRPKHQQSTTYGMYRPIPDPPQTPLSVKSQTLVLPANMLFYSEICAST